MQLHDRLLEWLRLADRQQKLAAFDNLFAVDAAVDGALCPFDSVRDMVEHSAPLQDVRPLVATGDATNGVVVFEARDQSPISGRVAWTFAARDGIIVEVVETISQGLPSPEESGRSTARRRSAAAYSNQAARAERRRVNSGLASLRDGRGL